MRKKKIIICLCLKFINEFFFQYNGFFFNSKQIFVYKYFFFLLKKYKFIIIKKQLKKNTFFFLTLNILKIFAKISKINFFLGNFFNKTRQIRGIR